MGKNSTLNMAALSEQMSQSLIGKVSSSLQLALEVPVAIETVSVPEKGACAQAGLAWKISFFKCYLSKISNIYDTVVVRFLCWSQIWNLIVNLGNSFGEFDVSPFKEIGAALACQRGFSKMAAEWHDWRLWFPVLYICIQYKWNSMEQKV